MFRFVRFLKCVLEHCNALFRSQQLVLSSLVISNSKTSFIGSILLQELIIQYSQNSALSKAKQRNLFRESPVSFWQKVSASDRFRQLESGETSDWLLTLSLLFSLSFYCIFIFVFLTDGVCHPVIGSGSWVPLRPARRFWTAEAAIPVLAPVVALEVEEDDDDGDDDDDNDDYDDDGDDDDDALW